MSKLLQLSISPNQSGVDSACNLTFQVFAPYSVEGITFLVNPNITDYIKKQENAGIEIRQFTFIKHTPETKQIFLDFKTNNVKVIQHEGKNIEVKLMNIGSEKFDNQDFLFFDIFVSETDLTNLPSS